MSPGQLLSALVFLFSRPLLNLPMKRRTKRFIKRDVPGILTSKEAICLAHLSDIYTHYDTILAPGIGEHSAVRLEQMLAETKVTPHGLSHTAG